LSRNGFAAEVNEGIGVLTLDGKRVTMLDKLGGEPAWQTALRFRR
jgi:hypothetical protein